VQALVILHLLVHLKEIPEVLHQALVEQVVVEQQPLEVMQVLPVELAVQEHPIRLQDPM
jgi:hypothetical protein